MSRESNRRLKIAVLSTYPPRECGLATFSADLVGSLFGAGVGSVGVVVLDRVEDGKQSWAATFADAAHARGPAVVAVIDDDLDASYRDGAVLTNVWADVVLVQHEFGIFGGDDGSMLLTYLHALTVPYVLTLHTVLPRFSPGQRSVLRAACEGAAAVTVFTATAKDLLVEQRILPIDRIQCIPHGAPAPLYNADRDLAREALGLEGRFVLSSFGLLSAGKGLELAIEALAVTVSAGVDAVLVVAGKTHPNVLRRDGERYRDSLRDAALAHGMSDRVVFMDGFLRVEEIADVLAATDVFVTPYVNGAQIVSGALTFALAAGCPVVSTPYLYAIDQLEGGAGVIVYDRDPKSFGDAILSYASDDEFREGARVQSRAIGSTMRWSSVGSSFSDLCGEVTTVARSSRVTRSEVVTSDRERVAVSAVWPLVTVHLDRLVDRRGIIQHATGLVPLLSSGYCIDDAARLITVATTLAEQEPRWEQAAAGAVALIGHAHLDRTSLLSNFMDLTGKWLDVPHFGDHVGRALMGLAAVASLPGYETLVLPLAAQVLHEWPDNSPLHPDAYALIAQSLAPVFANKPVAGAMLRRLIRGYGTNERADWCWPEPTIRYDQGRFPHAMISGGTLLGDGRAVEIGLRSLNWYSRQCDHETYLRFPGHRGWHLSDPLQRSGDEQPLEALAFVDAHRCAYEITGLRAHFDFALRGLAWFHGANRLALPMVDPMTGACADGLGSSDSNRNSGAESNLAFFAAEHAIQAMRANTPSVGVSVSAALDVVEAFVLGMTP